MILDGIANTGLIAIIRGTKRQEIIPLVDSLLEGGVQAVEITCNTPGAMEMIAEVKSYFKEELLVGAGTVLDKETARLAFLAGAQFLLAPHLSREVIEVGNLYGKPVIPGVMTPTEITGAMHWGAQMIKVFPAASLGPKYFKDVLGPLSQAKLMAVGGVNLDNAAEFLRAGANVLGIGGSLVKVNPEGGYQEVSVKAKKYLRIIREVREDV